MIAVIEIGSNTVKFLVSENGGTVRETFVPLRLSAGLADTGRISPEMFSRAVDGFKGLKEEAEGLGADKVVCVATAVLRQADNGAEFMAAVREECGLDIRILSGEEEGRVSFAATAADFGEDILVCDIGGASTELVTASEAVSLPLGVVKVTEMFKDPEEAYNHLLSLMPKGFTGSKFVAVGGTAVSFAKLIRPKENPHGAKITRGALEDMFNILSAAGAEQRREMMPFDPHRADVIAAGGIILRAALDAFDFSEFYVSTKGVRHGVAATEENNRRCE